MNSYYHSAELVFARNFQFRSEINLSFRFVFHKVLLIESINFTKQINVNFITNKKCHILGNWAEKNDKFVNDGNDGKAMSCPM